jgi:hypothetical protein
MRHAMLRSSALLLVLTVAGCAGTEPPRLFSPGPASYQRQQAQRFDPYPDNDMGPAMADVRPPDFQEPPPEPTRARWLKWGGPRLGF